MKQRAIAIGEAAAAFVPAAALVFCAGRARADDATAAPAVTAVTAVTAAKDRVLVTRELRVGGLRPREVVLFTERGLERMSPAQYAQMQQQALARLNPVDSCVP